MKPLLPSGYKKLGTADYIKSAIVSFIAVIIDSLLTGIAAVLTGSGHIDWMLLGRIALGSGISYLIKNYYTNSDGQFMRREQK